MGKMSRVAFAGLASVALMMSAATHVSARSGHGPMPVNYEQTAETYIADRLSNARGARIEVLSEPYQVYSSISGYEGLPCWAVDVRVKSRLPSGSYGSYQRYTVLFLDGEAIALESDARKVTRL